MGNIRRQPTGRRMPLREGLARRRKGLDSRGFLSRAGSGLGEVEPRRDPGSGGGWRGGQIGLGSQRAANRYVVQPDEVRGLRRGEAFVINAGNGIRAREIGMGADQTSALRTHVDQPEGRLKDAAQRAQGDGVSDHRDSIRVPTVVSPMTTCSAYAAASFSCTGCSSRDRTVGRIEPKSLRTERWRRRPIRQGACTMAVGGCSLTDNACARGRLLSDPRERQCEPKNGC